MATLTFVDVCAAVIKRKDRFLLAKRPVGVHMAGKWEFPGGKVKNGESLADCIIREIDEELGLQVADPYFIIATEYRYPEKSVRINFMTCHLAPDARHERREHQQVDWFTPDEILRLDLASADREFAEQLANHQLVT